MASIREVAQDNLDIARDGIGFIALWRRGRGWDSEVFWPDYNERTDTVTFEPEDIPRLQEIAAADPGAVLLRSYIDNVGGLEDLTRDDLAAGLRWQYDLQNARIVRYLENIKQEGRA